MYHQQMARKKAKAKGPSARALALVGEDGEFCDPENYQSLDGMEMRIVGVELGEDGKEIYTAKLISQGRGFTYGQLFFVPRSEFVTHKQKTAQADVY
jgi:hypothetical protein